MPLLQSERSRWFFVLSTYKTNTTSDALTDHDRVLLWFCSLVALYQTVCTFRGIPPLRSQHQRLHGGGGGGQKKNLSSAVISCRIVNGIVVGISYFLSLQLRTQSSPGKGMSWFQGKENRLSSFPPNGRLPRNPPRLSQRSASVAIRASLRRAGSLIPSCFSGILGLPLPTAR